MSLPFNTSPASPARERTDLEFTPLKLGASKYPSNGAVQGPPPAVLPGSVSYSDPKSGSANWDGPRNK